MGKGGSSTSVAIPEWLETAAKRNLGQADKISRLGPVPLSYGPTVADFTDAQYAGFNNTANTASAFGLNAPGAYSMGNPAATTFDNGVRALSAAPLFEGKMDAFAAARPAQKSYIDSFFIDPYSGQYGSNMAPLVNYDNYGTFADAVTATNGGGGGGSDAIPPQPTDSGPGMAGGTSFTTYGGHQDIAHETIDNAFINYGKEITAGIAKPEDNPAYNAEVAAANVNVPVTYTTDDGNTVTKPAGELTSADFTAASNDPATQYALAGASMAAAGIKNVGGGYNQNDPTTGFAGAITDAFGNIVETVAEVPGIIGSAVGLVDAPNSTYDPTGGDPNPPAGVVGNNDTGSNSFAQNIANSITPNDGTSYVNGVLVYDDSSSNNNSSSSSSNNSSSSSSSNNNSSSNNSSSNNSSSTVTISSGDTLSEIAAANNTTVAALQEANNISNPNVIYAGDSLVIPSNNSSSSSSSNDDGGGGSSGGGGSDCVVATHAVNSGIFTPGMKREAVVWCMHNLHDKWWGEAIRRGYRTLGRKKIEQGKAAEHYEEFRRYIDFASGKKRTLRGAITFTLRSAQFFVVGILNKEA